MVVDAEVDLKPELGCEKGDPIGTKPGQQAQPHHTDSLRAPALGRLLHGLIHRRR